VLEAERHDRLVAAISHLPFMAASALVRAVAEVGKDDEAVWQLAAGGFRDTSRVAASDTRMFLDILMTNRTAVLEQIESFCGQLDTLRRLLAEGDEAGLSALLAESQARRAAWRPAR
jgi:prephenate dehydrogenase